MYSGFRWTSQGMIISVLLLAAVLLRPESATGHDKNAIIGDLRAGRYSEARQILEEAIKQSPQDAALWTLNGFALSHLGQQKRALTSYKRAIQLSPDYLPALQGAAQI